MMLWDWLWVGGCDGFGGDNQIAGETSQRRRWGISVFDWRVSAISRLSLIYLRGLFAVSYRIFSAGRYRVGVGLYQLRLYSHA